MNKKAVVLLTLVLTFLFAAKVNFGQERGPSTPEEPE
jgi:hypothetical protein